MPGMMLPRSQQVNDSSQNGALSPVPSAPVPGSPETGTDAPQPMPGFLASLGLGADNPYFSAGFGLMGLGLAASFFRQFAKYGYVALQRRMLVNLELNIADPSYKWFLLWMSAQQRVAPGVPRAVHWARMHELSVETRDSDGRSFDLMAGQGTHFFKYRGAWIRMNRERETRSVNLNSGNPWETIKLTTLSRDRDIFPALISEAREFVTSGIQDKLIVYTAWGTEWKPFGAPRRKRPLSSVVLAPQVSERIETDVRNFLSRRDWYSARGIPYRRGYLLHGPPGSGKTSFIQSLAGKLGYDITVLQLSQRGMMDDKLAYLLSTLPPRTFVIIEDIDAAFNKRVQSSEDGYQSGVTFSGFLNSLDGVVSGEERIVFMTTNHIEKLDPALIRPGRVDLVELIDNAVPAQVYDLYTVFYGAQNEKIGRSLERLVEDEMKAGRRISMAELQGLFILTDAESVLDATRALLDRKYSTHSQ